MLINHKNFHFTQIPEKTNDVIFLKSPKTLFAGHFLTIFGHFCLMEIFSKKSGSVAQLYMGPYHHPKFQEKLMSQSWENLQTGWRTDGPYFVGPFLPRPGVQKKPSRTGSFNWCRHPFNDQKRNKEGIFNTIHRCAKANNKYMSEYDENKESSNLNYWDINNLYGWAMSNLRAWLGEEDTSKYTEDFIKNYHEKSETGYIFKLTLNTQKNYQKERGLNTLKSLLPAYMTKLNM